MVNFTARRSTPELVVPARLTPRETKGLSDVDDCCYLRCYMPGIEFFRSVGGESSAADPVKLFKAAVAEALVYYYPVAGRLREIAGGKLVVDCTGEGVVFVEADADVGLEEFGRPPYPCDDRLLCDIVDQHAGVVGKPLFYIQVTRLKHGAFALGLHMCHNIADLFGMIQFFNAIAQLASGQARPTVMPVWQREILKARSPPCIRHDIYPGYEPLFSGSPCIRTDDEMLSTPPNSMVGKFFHFSTNEIAALRRYVPVHLAESCTTFELLSAFMWRCRTVALGYEGGQSVRLVFRMNGRRKSMLETPIPKGYYGNVVLRPMVEADVRDLCGKPLGYAVELVRKAKLSMGEEHVRSTVDMMALLRTNPHLEVNRAFHVTDISLLGLNKLDLGWARRTGGAKPDVGRVSYHMACKNEDGDVEVLMSMLLPKPAMERLTKEISMWISEDQFIMSHL